MCSWSVLGSWNIIWMYFEVIYGHFAHLLKMDWKFSGAHNTIRDSIEVKILLFQLGALVSNSVRIQVSTQLLTQTSNWNSKTLTSTEFLPTLHFNLRLSTVEPKISRPFKELNLRILLRLITKGFGKDILIKMCFQQNLLVILASF